MVSPLSHLIMQSIMAKVFSCLVSRQHLNLLRFTLDQSTRVTMTLKWLTPLQSALNTCSIFFQNTSHALSTLQLCVNDALNDAEFLSKVIARHFTDVRKLPHADGLLENDNRFQAVNKIMWNSEVKLWSDNDQVSDKYFKRTPWSAEHWETVWRILGCSHWSCGQFISISRGE